MIKSRKIISYVCAPLFWFTNKLRTVFIILHSEHIKRYIKKVGQNVMIMPDVVVIGGGRMNIGCHTYIAKGCVISAWTTYKGKSFNPRIIIGKNVSLGEYNHISAIDEINIGDGVLTGRWVTITDNSHGNLCDDINQTPSERNLFSKGIVKIGDNVWIGDKATILPNVSIGEGAVIGANSVVTKDVPAFCVAAGNPAKIIRQLNGNIR